MADDTDLEDQDEGPAMGRPTLYTKELSDAVLMSIAVDELSLRHACAEHGVAPGTFCGWVVDDTDNLAERYMRARRIRAHGRLDEIVEIADDGSADWEETEKGGVRLNKEAIARAALRIDVRKFELTRILRNEFGDKVQVAATHSFDLTGAANGLAEKLGLANADRGTEGDAPKAG